MVFQIINFEQVGGIAHGGRVSRIQTPNTKFSAINSSLQASASGFDNFLDIVSDFRNSRCHFRTKDVAELRKGFAASFLLLIIAHYQLDKLARVDVRIAGVLDIRYDLLRNLRR